MSNQTIVQRVDNSKLVREKLGIDKFLAEHTMPSHMRLALKEFRGEIKTELHRRTN